ncbi:hypothetical protein DRQ15_02640 [candidate division KSB1 bacterium]|nr:MAG: hypothetical protein B5M50_03710 [candidate division KSB1 bacterium 4484_219]RKY79795.1 MAG: hypothetical protein DRQ12_02960 [candidate division KSB1 bacterium]RKY81156.1 MAG: hypothetical protein DRQ00_00495 [candidate division KSB1 bacterium]RKY86015.1 MAG: hypothetical protein DRQ11_09075 [candidate division KSB1 bacterium]RKY92309.1 MAG: hypothetical protein DRQ15_02640 [candidate division KSB1 bacterium]
MNNAIADLKNVVKLPRLYKAWFKLRERAKLVLGLTYYEVKEYDRAIYYLKQVSPQNENYPKALLGLGWCFLKLERYQDAVSPLEEFLQKYPQSEFVPEVYLLLGQCYLKIRLYDKAISFFNKIMALFPNDSETEDWIKKMSKRISQYRKEIEQQRADLLILESKLIETIHLPSKKYLPRFMLKECELLQKRRTHLLKSIDEEHKNCVKMMQEIDYLTRVMEKRSRDWRSYAQYGISRALFLKEQE